MPPGNYYKAISLAKNLRFGLGNINLGYFDTMLWRLRFSWKSLTSMSGMISWGSKMSSLIVPGSFHVRFQFSNFEFLNGELRRLMMRMFWQDLWNSRVLEGVQDDRRAAISNIEQWSNQTIQFSQPRYLRSEVKHHPSSQLKCLPEQSDLIITLILISNL